MIWHHDSRHARRSSLALAHRNRLRPVPEPLEGRTLLTAGALDTSFGGTGQVITDLAYNFSPKGLAVQPDLKTVVVGIEWPNNSNGHYPLSLALVRYNVNGSLDSTFGSGGEIVVGTNTFSPSEYPLHLDSVAIQSDGKIVVATNTATENSGSALTSCDMLVLRFNTNGSLDTSFGHNGETDIHLAQGMALSCGVAILPGGQIVVAGTNPNRLRRTRVRRGPAYQLRCSRHDLRAQRPGVQLHDAFHPPRSMPMTWTRSGWMLRATSSSAGCGSTRPLAPGSTRLCVTRRLA